MVNTTEQSGECMATQQYQDFCKNEFLEVKGGIDQINITLKELNKKLFIDNGSKSIQTKLNNLEFWADVNKWVVGVLATSVIGSLFTLITYLIRK